MSVVVEPADRGLPIFPLPEVVLLPGEVLPLHVFEPRYQALVAEVLAGDRHFGMATLRPVPVASGEVRPIFPELSIARIEQHRPMPGGRSNNLVRFVVAAQVVAELPTTEPFRRVTWTAMPELSAASWPATEALRGLAGHALAKVGALSDPSPVFSLSGPAFVDGLARLFLTDTVARRAYLTATTGTDRVTVVETALWSLLSATDGLGEA